MTDVLRIDYKRVGNRRSSQTSEEAPAIIQVKDNGLGNGANRGGGKKW